MRMEVVVVPRMMSSRPGLLIGDGNCRVHMGDGNGRIRIRSLLNSQGCRATMLSCATWLKGRPWLYHPLRLAWLDQEEGKKKRGGVLILARANVYVLESHFINKLEFIVLRRAMVMYGQCLCQTTGRWAIVTPVMRPLSKRRRSSATSRMATTDHEVS